MLQSQLSAEIIILIVSYLPNDKRTLHSLLTVNRLFFNTVVPFLYRDPFRFCLWRNGSKIPIRKILYLLLASSNLLHKLSEITTRRLDWALTNWVAPTAPFTVKYLQYYVEVDFTKWQEDRRATFYYDENNSEGAFGHNIFLLFCKYNAKNIKSVTFPILDMKPYLPMASKMASLRRIEFCRVSDRINHNISDQDIATVKDAVSFVKTHVETYNETLTEITFADFQDIESRTLPDVHIEDIIRVLKRPQVIETHNSYRFCRYLQSPTTDHLRAFGGPYTSCAKRIQDWDPVTFLQRCPKLEKVFFTTTQPNIFKWAAKRRASLMDSGFETMNFVDEKLPPLQHASILCSKVAALPIVEEIVYAFRNTIKSIIIEDNRPLGYNPIPLSWDWLLPNLVVIRISEGDFSLFDLGSLNLCPSLKEICLLSRHGYRSYPIAEFGPILVLPNLREIELEQEISYQFNLDSLKHSPLLESFMLYESGPCLPRRSTNSPCWTWTWDWDLWHLKKLELVGESAFLFQFHLLDLCPSLELFKLHTQVYVRYLTLEEVSRTDSPFPSESRDEFCGNSTFILDGKWELSGETLSTLLQRYFSHVTEIYLPDTGTLTVSDIVDATQSLPHCVEVNSGICLTSADIEETGMDVDFDVADSVGIVGSVTYVLTS